MMSTSVRRRAGGAPLGWGGFIVLPAILVVLAACAEQAGHESTARLPATISGVVNGAGGPAAGAIVQVQGTPNQVRTAADGTFTLHGQGLGGTAAVTITAWAEGHFIGWVSLDPRRLSPDDAGTVSIALQPLFAPDNPDYTWFTHEGVSGAASCGLCHREYAEWQADAHARSAQNPRFISMFRGTNIEGKRGQPTRWGSDGKLLPPDPALPDYGPGFRLDNPDHAGNCATCHTPVAAKTPNTNTCAWSGCHSTVTADRAETIGLDIRGVMPVGLMGIAEEGVTCEFCHVVGGVTLDPNTRMPYPDMPGILSMRLQRPPNGQKQFFGTLTDANREQVTYAPFLSTSEFCAACHFGVFGGVVANMRMTGGTVIYNSYGEWLNSPYADPNSGYYRTCQDCHMPVKDTRFSVPPEKGGIARDYVTYHDHTMPGADSSALLWNAVTLDGSATRQGDTLLVQVGVTNDKTGHAVPTDSPMRSVMLVVEARDAQGQLLELRNGPTLPEWTGDYAGRPGKAFAKILQDNWSGEVPATAFWRPTTLIADTRLFPFTTDTTSYAFHLPDGQSATVKVSLVYRRAFYALARQKGWNDPDHIMAEKTLRP